MVAKILNLKIRYFMKVLESLGECQKDDFDVFWTKFITTVCQEDFR